MIVKKHAFFMKNFSQNLKTVQKHTKEDPETQKKNIKLFIFVKVFFYKKINFGPHFGGKYHILVFFKLQHLLALFLVQQAKKRPGVG